MKGSMSTDLGIITVSPEVIAKYAGTVAVECFGIVGMAAVNMKDGLVRLLKRTASPTASRSPFRMTTGSPSISTSSCPTA